LRLCDETVTLTARITGWLQTPAPFAPRSSQSAQTNRRQSAAVAVRVALVVALVLQAALGIAGELSLYIRDPGYSDKEIRLARQEDLHPGEPEIVMLGTSRTAAAFHAGLARERLGNREIVFNFGIPASGPITHLLYFRRMLRDGHRPDLLILEVLPPTLGDLPGGGPDIPEGPLEGRFLFGDRLRHDELETAISYGFPASDVREKWRRSVVLPWYSLRFPITGRIMPSAQPWRLRFDWSRGCDEFGWGAPFASSVTPEEYEKLFQHAVDEYRDILATLEPTGGGARALGDLAELCRRESIPLHLVLMPEASRFRAMYPATVLRQVHGFLNEVCSQHNCTYTDAREWLPDDGFSDGHHMLKGGAERFSDRLTREVIEPMRPRR
jgi:hypothetical protein